MPEEPEHRLSHGTKLVRSILASGALAIFVACIFAYLSLAGVIDMTIARGVLIIGGSVAFLGILVSELLWGKTKKQKAFFICGSGIFLTLSLWGLDNYASKHREVKSDSPPVAVENNGTWNDDHSVVNGPNGRAVKNNGNMNLKGTQINPKFNASDTAEISQLTTFIGESHSLFNEKMRNDWNNKVTAYLRGKDKEVAKTFAAESDIFKKQKILINLVQEIESRNRQ